MSGNFDEPIAALRTYAITRRREADKKRDEASLLLRAADELLQTADDFAKAADLLSGPKPPTPEEQKALDAIVKEFGRTSPSWGRLFR